MAKEAKTATQKKKETGYSFKFSNTREDSLPRAGHRPLLLDRYEKVVVPALKKEFNYKNKFMVPTISKVVLNIGLGEAIKQPKLLEQSFEALGNITGQRPVITRAKKSIAGFKLREGMKLGCMATLRNAQMWDFLDRLLMVSLPRTRDFRGVSSKAFDGRGNYTLGIKEILIFPEVKIDNLTKVPGMNICIQTTANTDQEARVLLSQLGMPFRQ